MHLGIDGKVGDATWGAMARTLKSKPSWYNGTECQILYYDKNNVQWYTYLVNIGPYGYSYYYYHSTTANNEFSEGNYFHNDEM